MDKANSGFQGISQIIQNYNSISTDGLKKEISEFSKTAYNFLKENKLNEAEDLFRLILEKDPDNSYAYVGFGDIARKRKQYQEAIDFYKKCLTKNPENSYALFGLADYYRSQNQYKLAISVWQQYLKYDEKNITVYTRIADAYRKIHDFPKSKTTYFKVLEMDQNNSYALIGLGHLHFDFKFYSEAQYYLKKMLDENNEADIRIITMLGNCCRKLKNYNQGIYYFKKALELDNNNFFALFGLANCYKGIQKHKDALKNWLKILEFDPKNKIILTRAGDAYSNLKDYDTAESYYRQVLNIGFDIFAVLGLTHINKLKGKYSEAIEALESLGKNAPSNYRIYTELFECYIAINDKEKIKKLLDDYFKYGFKISYLPENIATYLQSNF